jgi:hypothetical protein
MSVAIMQLFIIFLACFFYYGVKVANGEFSPNPYNISKATLLCIFYKVEMFPKFIANYDFILLSYIELNPSCN